MKNNEYWDEKAKELIKLKEQRKELNKKINALESSINEHNRSYRRVEDSMAYKMFGKCHKDLTDEEKKEYRRMKYKEHKEKIKEDRAKWVENNNLKTSF